MSEEPADSSPGAHLPPGSHDLRAFVGPPEKYDLVSAMQFNLLTLLGLREHHALLDIGCGSLRAGRLLITYLLPDRYFGIEPERWLVEEGIRAEVGEERAGLKRPTFIHAADFGLSAFERSFDFILAQSIFSHASQDQIRHCLSEVRRVMEPTGLFAATYMRGETDYTGSAWVYPGCVTFTEERMVELAEEQGLALKPLDWPHPNGQSWVLIHHPGHADDLPAIGSAAAGAKREEELRSCRDQLAALERHPYVRFGLAVRGLLRRLRSVIRLRGPGSA